MPPIAVTAQRTGKPVWYCPVCYRRMNRQDPTYRECLADIWDVLLLRLYVKASQFIGHMDLVGFQWILNMKHET